MVVEGIEHETVTIPRQGTFIIPIHSDIEREAIELICLFSELSLVDNENQRERLNVNIEAQKRKLNEAIVKADVAVWEQDPDDAPEMIVQIANAH